jgi:uncharacterized protein YdaU (DUF1376 family)
MTGLSLEERGAYTTILFAIYAKGGPIEDEPGYFRALLCCSAKAWIRLRASLIVKRKLYECMEGGLPSLMNRRAAELIEERRAEYKKFSEAGARGGSKRKAQLKENNGLEQAPLEPGLSPPQANRTEADTEQKIAPPSPQGGPSESTLSAFYKRAFEAFPQSGRASTHPGKARDAWDEAAKAVDPEKLISAVVAFAASDFAKEGGGRRVPSFQRWLSEGRYTAWVTVRPVNAFNGPPELRREALAEKGEGWVKTYLDPCHCRNGVLVPRTITALEKIQREIPHLLKAHNVLVVWEKAA